jgi:DNA-binding beta-propeller fold protein YncE/phospholipase C
MKRSIGWFTGIGLVSLAALLTSQTTPREQVGPLSTGGFLLASGWKLEPAGKQIPLSTMPMASVVTPDGKYMLVLNGGYRPPTIHVIDTATGTVKGETKVTDGWLGLALSPDGSRVYVGGGSAAAVFEFSLADGVLTATRAFPVVTQGKPGNQDFIGDVALSPDGRLIYAADLYRDSVVVLNPQSGMLINRFKTGRRPYRILFHPDGKSFFVSHWADGTVGHYDTETGSQLTNLRIGMHPTDMVWREGGPPEADPSEPGYAARLFVAAANTNNVYSVGVSAAKELKVIESINLAMTPRQPVGMTPSGLAISPDGKRLYAACSDGNVAAVVDISTERSRVEGFIPTGWYPTAVRVLKSGTLIVLNGKGLRSYPTRRGAPNPTTSVVGEGTEPGVRTGYVGYMQTGTASWIEPFSVEQLDTWTKRAMAYSPYTDAKLDEKPALPPIEHIIYIVRENRTYDQVLGDMKEGNGDASLTLFGEEITPNAHKLAREFVLFDNFYVNADVSADGHTWATAAIAPDYVQRMWPNQYAGRRKQADFLEQDAASLPPAGYIWTSAASLGISMRNFGYVVNNKTPIPPTGEEQITTVRDPILAKYTNRKFRTFDLQYPDVDRAKIFLEEFAEYEKSGTMPKLVLMRLGNDHTSGTTANRIAPLSAVADNDYALGMIVEAVSKSKFWPTTAIFVLEDDAQNGPDHVDSHRSPGFVISAYSKRKVVDSTMYNTASMLRTMELMLGMRPMTQFDASARVMATAFQQQSNPAPYVAEKPHISLDTKNAPTAPKAAASNRMNFDEADEADDDELNEILWRAIRGNEPPPPVRSYFGK